MPVPRGASVTCLNGHSLKASWPVPAGRKKGDERVPAVRAINTACPLCGNKLAIFIDGRADPRTIRLRAN